MIAVSYDAGAWGVGELWLDGDLPLAHELPWPGRTRQGPGTGQVLTEKIRSYFAGERVEFGDVEVDLEWCTPFQRAVAETLRAVPYGETVTYGELAALAGYPNAHRAAGTFCAQNRLPLIVPCHRVLAAGGIGGYGSLGVDYKRRLLELEDAVI